MRKLMLLCLVGMLAVVGAGCAVTMPTNAYTPQNFVRAQGQIDMGEFIYVPLADGTGKVKKSNQIQNTAAGSIYLSTDVADFVKRGTALELEKTGILLSDKCPYALSANILEFKADDLGTLWTGVTPSSTKLRTKRTEGQFLIKHSGLNQRKLVNLACLWTTPTQPGNWFSLAMIYLSEIQMRGRCWNAQTFPNHRCRLRQPKNSNVNYYLCPGNGAFILLNKMENI